MKRKTETVCLCLWNCLTNVAHKSTGKQGERIILDYFYTECTALQRNHSNSNQRNNEDEEKKLWKMVLYEEIISNTNSRYCTLPLENVKGPILYILHVYTTFFTSIKKDIFVVWSCKKKHFDIVLHLLSPALQQEQGLPRWWVAWLRTVTVQLWHHRHSFWIWVVCISLFSFLLFTVFI